MQQAYSRAAAPCISSLQGRKQQAPCPALGYATGCGAGTGCVTFPLGTNDLFLAALRDDFRAARKKARTRALLPGNTIMSAPSFWRSFLTSSARDRISLAKASSAAACASASAAAAVSKAIARVSSGFLYFLARVGW